MHLGLSQIDTCLQLMSSRHAEILQWEGLYFISTKILWCHLKLCRILRRKQCAVGFITLPTIKVLAVWLPGELQGWPWPSQYWTQALEVCRACHTLQGPLGQGGLQIRNPLGWTMKGFMPVLSTKNSDAVNAHRPKAICLPSKYIIPPLQPQQPAFQRYLEINPNTDRFWRMEVEIPASSGRGCSVAGLLIVERSAPFQWVLKRQSFIGWRLAIK